jgi:hypothetical protein
LVQHEAVKRRPLASGPWAVAGIAERWHVQAVVWAGKNDAHAQARAVSAALIPSEVAHSSEKRTGQVVAWPEGRASRNAQIEPEGPPEVNRVSLSCSVSFLH